MTIESVTDITDLDPTYPEFDDYGSEGDDHIRNIKTGISYTFNGFLGGVQLTVTEAELNYMDGVTSAVQTQLDSKKLLGYGFESASDNVRPTPGSDSVFESLVYTKQSDTSVLLVMLTAMITGGYAPGSNVFGTIKLNVDSGTNADVMRALLGDLGSNKLVQNVTATHVFTGISSGSRTINAMLNSVGASEVDERQIALLEVEV